MYSREPSVSTWLFGGPSCMIWVVFTTRGIGSERLGQISTPTAATIRIPTGSVIFQIFLPPAAVAETAEGSDVAAETPEPDGLLIGTAAVAASGAATRSASAEPDLAMAIRPVSESRF